MKAKFTLFAFFLAVFGGQALAQHSLDPITKDDLKKISADCKFEQLERIATKLSSEGDVSTSLMNVSRFPDKTMYLVYEAKNNDGWGANVTLEAFGISEIIYDDIAEETHRSYDRFGRVLNEISHKKVVHPRVMKVSGPEESGNLVVLRNLETGRPLRDKKGDPIVFDRNAHTQCLEKGIESAQAFYWGTHADLGSHHAMVNDTQRSAERMVASNNAIKTRYAEGVVIER